MEKVLLISLISSFCLVSCSPIPPPPNENTDLLYQRFHGKYEAIQSTSSEAIDVNLDGKAMTDMLVEIPQLNKQYGNHLELRIYGYSANRLQYSFLFSEYWPEQYLSRNDRRYEWVGDIISYDPDLIVNYLQQGGLYTFSFSPDIKQIKVNPSTVENTFRWLKPESVTINPDDTVQVVTKRRLYTGAGVKNVTITTIYKRYTMVT